MANTSESYKNINVIILNENKKKSRHNCNQTYKSLENVPCGAINNKQPTRDTQQINLRWMRYARI